ncbi:hypothetical protein J2R76_002512 [Bradyrhizobium sp. USDA 4532]|uniref:glycosyltransferase family 87 protein n=1 Tax=unclassified Bradyrhizobium TaxID=2631580 RepID=UPI00209E5C27|nr:MULTISPECIES: glycosyltransferase family 87 protein [unclassified Bradyrhizobium]MCP1834175.1 hypothetical protein [Bradyrhizobium sp. USDA 4545]MCP1918921.1 hypothetical protein [Bradyrhizobium sp. USDA 4532]
MMLRDMPWLTSQRARLYGCCISIALALIFTRWTLLLYFAGGDFLSFWAASSQALAGHPAEVYLPELHQIAEATYSQGEYEAFFYPPTYLVVCLPLALAPYFVSFFAFMGTTGALFIASILRITRSPWSLIAILAYPPFYFNLAAGQNGFLTTSILGFGLTILNQQPRLAGAVLGLMAIKPHLALGLPIALIVTRRWLTLAWAGIAAVGLAISSYVLFGSDTWRNFFDISHSARATLENGHVNFWKFQSIFVMVRTFGTSVTTAYVLHGIFALCAVCALVWTLRKPINAAAERSIILLACLLITPFLLFYDMLIMALPLAWMLREWQDGGFPPWSKLVLCAVFFAPMLFYLPIVYNLSSFLGPMTFGPPFVLLFGWVLVRGATKNPVLRNYGGER